MFRQLLVCNYGVASLITGWVCNLQSLLGLASAVFLSSEPRGFLDHILLSQFWDFPTLSARLLIYYPRNIYALGRYVSSLSPLTTHSYRNCSVAPLITSWHQSYRNISLQRSHGCLRSRYWAVAFVDLLISRSLHSSGFMCNIVVIVIIIAVEWLN
jgi:hypothetical protein